MTPNIAKANVFLLAIAVVIELIPYARAPAVAILIWILVVLTAWVILVGRATS